MGQKFHSFEKINGNWKTKMWNSKDNKKEKLWNGKNENRFEFYILNPNVHLNWKENYFLKKITLQSAFFEVQSKKKLNTT